MNPITKILSHATTRCANHSTDYELLVPEIKMAPGIPKFIHQICLTSDGELVLSEEMNRNITFLKSNNPLWDYKLYDNAEAEHFILEYFGPAMLSYYNRIDTQYRSAKADLLKYLISYAIGGVYLDIKATISQPFDLLFGKDDRLTLFRWPDLEVNIPEDIKGKMYITSVIICKRGDPIIRQVIISLLKALDNYNPFLNGVGWTGVMCTTGPWMYSRAVNGCENLYGTINQVCRVLCVNDESIGYVNNIHGADAGWTYQKASKMNDYRRGTRSVFKTNSKVLSFLNNLWLRFLGVWAINIH